MTFYEILGVHETAPPEVIEAAWKALMKKFHPDSQTPNLELTQKINAAHDVLADEAKRKAYDAQLKAQKDSARFQHPGFQHPWMEEQGAYPNAYPNAYPQPRGVALDHVIQNAAQSLAHAAFESLIEQMPPAVQHGIRNAMRYGKRRAS